MHNRYPMWKYVLLVFMVIFAAIYAAPNLYGEDIAVQISHQDASPVSQSDVNKVTDALKQHNIPFLSAGIDEKQILVRFEDTDTQLKASDYIKATVGDKYIVAPNLAARTPQWLQNLGAEPLKLGLDLRGGVHFLLNVDINAVMKARETGDVHSISNELRQANIRYSRLTSSPNNGIVINFRDEQTLQQAYKLVPKRFPEYVVTQQMNDGSYTMRAVLSEAAVTKLRNYAVEQSMSILRNRINELGVSEAVVQRQGMSKISVDMPGVQDTTRAKDIIGKTATLEFRLVDDEHDLESAMAGVVPIGSRLYKREDGRPILLKSQVILRGSSITYATAAFDETNSPQVNVQLGGGGERTFHKVTAANVGKAMAVVYVETKTTQKIVNGEMQTVRTPVEKVINVATIQSALGNSFRITGLQSQRYSQDLALLLRSGSFTAPIEFVQERIVGPKLGKENIRKGITSLIYGFILIVLFMLAYYRMFGFFANMALLLNVVFIVALLSLLGATLTLPGIAGIVLTVGMAVDANVLINERIREELRHGMSPQAAIRAGYERAFSTIVDANVTTLIVAVVLFTLGSGQVKGFAVTLSIGLLTSMLTAIFFTRALVNLIYGKRKTLHSLSIGTVQHHAHAS